MWKTARILPPLTAIACLLVPQILAPAALNAPEWVGIYEVEGKAGLLWIKTAAYKTFRILRRRTDETGFTAIGQTGDNRYTDGDVLPNIGYVYRLIGIAPDGKESPPSLELPFTIKRKAAEAGRPPRWEGHLVLERGIGLKWEKLDPSTIVAYNVYRAQLPDGRPELLGSTRETTLTDYRVEDGQEYRYWLTAVDGNFRETPASEDLVVTYVKKVTEKAAKTPAYTWVPRRSILVKMITTGEKEVPLRCPTGVALLPGEKLVLVADSGNGFIQAYSKEGDYRYHFAVPSPDPSAQAYPLGVAVDREGKIYCTDAYSGRILVFHARGGLFRVLNTPRAIPGEVFGFLGVAVAGNGRVYFVDNPNNRLGTFDPEGKFSGFFGTPGRDPGQLNAPGFCLLDPKGRLVISDALGGRIQFFSSQGVFQKAFGRQGRNVGCLSRPKGIAVDSKGLIYVADSWLCQVQAFDEEGNFLFVVADEDGRPLDLGSPNGIAVDEAGTIYIAERLSNRVQVRRFLGE